jgi:hypothetical protein
MLAAIARTPANAIDKRKRRRRANDADRMRVCRPTRRAAIALLAASRARAATGAAIARDRVARRQESAGIRRFALDRAGQSS